LIRPEGDTVIQESQEDAFKKALAERRKRFQNHQKFVYFG
jgi:hypothetical protein